MIGNVIESLDGTDISIVKLNRGLRYTDKTFGTATEPSGIRIRGISRGFPPHLRVFDPAYVNNHFTGGCEGATMALGVIIPEEGRKDYVGHVWHLFENGEEPIDSSCGSLTLDAEGDVVALFRFKKENSDMWFSVAAF